MSAESGQQGFAEKSFEQGNPSLSGARAADHERIVFTLRHPVDVGAFRSAFRAVIEQHVELREQGEPADVEAFDWRHEPDDAVRSERLEALLRDHVPPVASVLHLVLIQWDATSFRCVCYLYRDRLDWRSFSLLLRELFAHYRAAVHGVTATATVPRAQRAMKTTADDSADEPFWQDFLADAALPFRLDLPAPESATTDDSDCIEHRFDAAASDSISRLRKAADVTMNNLVQAAWALVLSRYANTRDVTFGIVRSCRHSMPPGSEEALGCFVNTVPLRLPLSMESNVFELLWSVRDRYRALRERECDSASAIARIAGVDEPLFDTTLEYDLRDPLQTIGELFGEDGPADFRCVRAASSQLELQVYGEESLVVRLRYRGADLDRTMAEQVSRHFCNALMQMAREPWIAVKDLDFLDETDKAACRWPAAQRLRSAGKAGTIHGVFEDRVRLNGNAVAVSCGDVSLTYRELNRRANRLARDLRARGVKPDQLVGLCAERSVDLVVGLLGILKSGAGYLPLDPAYPAERLRFMLDDANVRCVVSTSTAGASLPQGDHEVIAPPAEAGEDDEVLAPRSSARDLAYVIYTSGSTGKPKGVMVEHRNVLRLFETCESWLNPGIGDVWSLFHSFAFDFSVWEIWGALLYGGRLEIVPVDVARSPDAFHDFLEARGVTVLNQTPSAFRQLMRVNAQRQAALPALRLVVFGGEKLDFAELRDWFARHGDTRPQLVNMYGITETTVHVTCRPILASDAEGTPAARIGCPLPDLYVRLLDGEGRPVPPGVRGEIHVGGAGVARGYLNRPQLTGERFVADPLQPDARLYRSGDFARLLPNGELAYLGREDDQVKIRGFRIDLGEVTHALASVDGVRQAVVVARESAGTKRLVGYYVADTPDVDPEQVRAALVGQLPAHMVPAVLVPLPEMPVNANNKIDFRSLPDPAHATAVTARSVARPESASEAALAEIWCRVLERSQVDRQDDFFRLGGDSILAVRLVSIARERGVEIMPHDVFTHPVLADLARVIDQRGETDAVFTPAQRELLDMRLVRPDHCNRSRLFRLPQEMDVDALERAMLAVLERHVPLRTRAFRDDSGEWRAETVRPVEALEFSRIELDHLDEHERREAITLIADDIQSSLSVSSGLLMRAAHFTGGSESGDRLLIVVHRFAMDGISWKPLLAGIERAYRSIVEVGDEAIDDEASRPEWQDCLKMVAKNAHGGSMLSGRAANGREGNAREVLVRIPGVSAGKVRPECLLGTLAHALAAQWPEREQWPIVMMSDARRKPGNETLANVVGPLCLPETVVFHSSDTSTVERATARARSVLHGSSHASAGDSAFARIEVERLDDVNVQSACWLEPLEEFTGPQHAAENCLPFPLTVNVQLNGDAVYVAFRHDPSVLDAERVEAVAEVFRSTLSDVESGRDVLHSLADYPFARLTTDELSRFPLDLADVEDVLALSPIQRLHHALAGTDRDVAFDQWVFRLRGDIDLESLRAGWQELFRRHAALRTVFVDQGLSEPHQVVLRDVDTGIHVEDWSRLEATARAERLDEWLAQDRRRGFAPDDVPLMRGALIRESSREWTFIWSHHQALVDGWSWPVLAGELGELHDAAVEQREAKLPPAGSHRRQVEWLAGRDEADYARFWRTHLQNVRTGTRLGRDRNSGRPDIVTFVPELRRGLGEKLVALSRQLGLTPGVVIQSAWALLLAGLTRRFEVTLGVAFSGRASGLALPEHTVGSFVNDLPVHVKIRPTERVDHWLSEQRAMQADLARYQNVSPQEVHRWAGIAPGTRLFDTLVVFQNYATGRAARQWGKRIKVREFRADTRTNYPLTLAIDPGNELGAAFFHDTRVFDTATVRALAGDFQKILAAMADKPDIHVATLVNHVDPLTSEADSPAGRRDSVLSANSDVDGKGDDPETVIARVCAEVLESAIGRDTNFFDAGAQSVTLIEIHERLQRTLQRTFPIVTLFRFPSIRALARHLDEDGGSTVDAAARGARRRAALQRRRQVQQPGNLER